MKNFFFKNLASYVLFLLFTSLFMFLSFYYTKLITYLYIVFLGFIIPLNLLIASQNIKFLKLHFFDNLIKKFIFLLDKTNTILIFIKLHEFISFRLTKNNFLCLSLIVNFLCLIYCVVVKIFFFFDKSILISINSDAQNIYLLLLFFGLAGIYLRLIISFIITIMNTSNRILIECVGGGSGGSPFSGKFNASNFSRINNTVNHFNNGPKNFIWMGCTIGFGLCSLGVAAFTAYQIHEQNVIARQNLLLQEYNSGIISKDEYIRSRR